MENAATDLRNQILTLRNCLPVKPDSFKISQKLLDDLKQQRDHGSVPGHSSGRRSFRGLALPVRRFKRRLGENASRAFARAGTLAAYAAPGI
jgi:hypothetical protein